VNDHEDGHGEVADAEVEDHRDLLPRLAASLETS
jgi:hypothetical protein